MQNESDKPDLEAKEDLDSSKADSQGSDILITENSDDNVKL